jgi:long-chain acyl-CoA synthetase
MLEWLFDRFASAADRQAVVWRDESLSYGQLEKNVAGWKARLTAEGVGPGSVVSLEGDYSPVSVAVLLALVDIGAVVVPLTATVSAHKPRFREIAEVQVVLDLPGGNDLHLQRTDRRPENPLTRQLIESGQAGLVVFSSGSTGEPKAILHDFSKLLAKYKLPRSSLRAITFLLLDHLGGINTLFYILCNLGTVIAVEDRNPEVVCAAVARHRAELLPTTPTFLNLMLLSEAYQRHDLSSLRQITYGTEPMPEYTLQRVHELLPHVNLLQTYGLSELGVLRSKSKASNSLLFKIGGEGFETKVVDGTLRIRASSSMLGYLNAPSPFDKEGWLDTGDEVVVEGEYLRILGRRSELINVGGQKVYPSEVESVLLQVPNVIDAGVRGEPNPITGRMVVARLTLATPEDPASLRRRVRGFCRERLAPFKVPSRVEIASGDQHSGRFKKRRIAESAESVETPGPKDSDSDATPTKAGDLV